MFTSWTYLHIFTLLGWVEVNWGASCSLAGSLSQSNYLTLASREALLSCAVCQCVALHSISFYCTAFPCYALQYECSFTHCGAAGVHWWARGMGRHMVDKTWPGVRSSAAGAGGAAAGGAGGKMKDDSLVPSSLLLPQSMDVHSTVKQQSILSLMLHPVASVASSYTESWSSLWNSEMQVFFAHDQVWSIVWGGQAHPRTHRSQLWLVGVLEGEHLIGRENHGESSPSGCLQLRMDRSTLWLVCLICNGVTWKRFKDALHS